MRQQDAMRRDWDERARKDAFHYIASWRKDWDLPSFLRSGQEDYARFVQPVLARCNIPCSGSVMIELGCGAGRMSHAFAEHYQQVIAVDLSWEMLRRAREIHATKNNILWLNANGLDLTFLASGSGDFVFSYLVLQHLPNEDLVFSYIREMLRVLRPGGAFLFQFNGCHKPTMNFRGRLLWGTVDALWSAGLSDLSRKTVSMFGWDPATAGRSWRGAAISASRIAALVESIGGDVREMPAADTPLAWCCGVKKAPR